jgi:cytidylate kinase
VSIDGPAGAGKSSVAKALARELGFIYVDSGAMYRALTWLAIREGVSLDDELKLGLLARAADIRFCQSSSPSSSEDRQQRVYCQGQDVTEDIRSLAVSQAVSRVSAISGVREAMVEAQRSIAANHDVVMEGRDIGTVVLPDAECKIYMTATVEERAARRKKEREGNGQDRLLASIIGEIAQRDHDDMHRSISPLRRAEDSVLLDSTSMSFDEALEEALRIVRSVRTYQ